MVTDDNTEYHGKYFVLTNDITLNDNVINEAGTGLKKDESSYRLWTPIGEYGVTACDDFRGIFDGQGHTIRGMVCIDYEGDRDFNGLFGTVDEATIKNLYLEDCYLCGKQVNSNKQEYGVLTGDSRDSKFMNCHISKSVVDITHIYNSWWKISPTFFVGGMVGRCDYCSSRAFGSSYRTDMTDCSFKGNIYVNAKDVSADSQIYIGGLIGEQALNSGNELYLVNCKTEGEIYYITSAEYIRFLYIGGISAGFNIGEPEIKNCVNRMNITVDTKDNVIGYCYVSGMGYALSTDDKYKVSQCVSFGTIKIGNNTQKAKINWLYLHGLLGDDATEKRVNLSNSAFYGKFDIHCTGTYAYITPLCYKYVETGVPSVVCSVGNVFDLEYNSTYLDQVCNITKCVDEDGDLIESKQKHQCYYRFESTSSNVTFPCTGTEDASKYNKTLEEMKAEGFISTLNNEAGGNVWGKLTGMSDASLNGLPMQVSCGGVAITYSGEGTKSDPCIINSEADLLMLKIYLDEGRIMKDSYFKLGSDIRITGTLNESIGKDYERPFKGHLDGNGHAIIGLRKSLFGYMYGTVKNLALVDCDIWDGNYATALARSVGDEKNKAEVSNCYVSGTISFSTPWDQLGYASTFAFQLAKGSSIHDCYFKGRFIVKEQTFSTYNVAGIAIYDSNRTVNTSAESPEGIFNCYASFDVKVEASDWQTRYTYGISSESLNDESKGNYFVCSDYRVHQYYNGGIKLNSESELNAKFAGKAGWLQGVYRPLLASAKIYKATSPDGETAYFDAIPESNPKKNYFYNISIDNPYSDVSLWSLPNMAVYVPSEQKDYITSGYIDQSSELKYKRSEGAIGTLGQLHFSLVQNNKGSHFVCLPGQVLKSDLPEGSDAMIVGKINYVNDEEQVNVVHVDTIPAGVPCFLYVPVTAVKSGNNIDMLMRSGIVSEPVMNADYSSFKGTFTPQTVSEQACLDVAKETFKRAATRGAAQVEDAYYFIRSNEQAEVKPFSAWIESSLGNVRIVDYLLLDEYSQTNEELIENSTDDVNIKLRLTMDANKWTTICLPFDMSGEEIAEKFGQDTKLEEIESISYDGTMLNIRLKEATDGIINGYPYFIKPSAGNSIFDLGPRILSNELSEDGYMAISPDATRELSLQMGGAYGISVLSSTKDYGAYYFSDGTLIQVSTDKPFAIGGFRCWFKASDAMASAPIDLSSVIITYSDGTTTEISVVAEDSQSAKQTVYDLRGIEMKTEKGLFIKNGIKIIRVY